MDSLKSLILEKKKAKKLSEQDSQKWLTGKELKEKTSQTNITQDINLQEKKNEIERVNKLTELMTLKTNKNKIHDSSQTSINSHQNSSEQNSFENNLVEDAIPPISKEEIFTQLRRFREPVTLFGETDAQRFKRMCQLELNRNDDGLKTRKQNFMIDTLAGRETKNENFYDEFEDGYTYARYGEEPRKRAKGIHPIDHLESDYSEASDSELLKDKKSIDYSRSDNAKVEMFNNIKSWIKSMLKEWEEELHNRTEDQKRTTEGRTATGMHRQTRKDLKPLLKKIKSKSLEDDILGKLGKMVELCQKRHYREAHDIYMLLAIGNAAWPMGVTMVGIHERAGRSKIFTSEVAHILNDETTRKYIQMFKRLMSFSQRKYPADPSQMVKIASVNV